MTRTILWSARSHSCRLLGVDLSDSADPPPTHICCCTLTKTTVYPNVRCSSRNAATIIVACKSAGVLLVTQRASEVKKISRLQPLSLDRSEIVCFYCLPALNTEVCSSTKYKATLLYSTTSHEDGLTMYRLSFVSPRRRRRASTLTPDRRRSSVWAGAHPRRPACGRTPAVWESATSSPISGRGWLDTCSDCWLENHNKLICEMYKCCVYYRTWRDQKPWSGRSALTLFLSVGHTARQVREAKWNLSILSGSSLVCSCDGKCCRLVTENKVRWSCLTPLLKEKGWPVFYSILDW